MNIIAQKEKRMTFHSLELHKVYQSLYDGDFYTLAKISYNNDNLIINCLLNLNTMKGHRMCDLTARTDEFTEVDYTFKIGTKD